MSQTKKKLPISSTGREGSRWYYEVKYKGNLYKVPMLKYQTGAGSSQRKDLPCIIYESEDNPLRIVQDHESVVAELYTVGSVYTFTVRSKISGYYTVQDDNGLTAHLIPPPKGQYNEGQSVEAKVIAIDRQNITLEPLVTADRLADRGFMSWEAIAAAVGSSLDDLEPLITLVESNPDFSEAYLLYSLHESRWILEALCRLDDHLLNNPGAQDARQLTDLFSRLCVYLIEESDFLMQRSEQDRAKWIERLSAFANHGEDYREAYNILAEGRGREYVAKQLDNLRRSEYLYQPGRKFRIMTCIFNTQEDIMAEMMDRIFSIILGGDKSHWQAEPFRKAFVDMLELFIARHRPTVGHTANEALPTKMVTALAIQQLLSNSEDDIDRRLNRVTYLRLLTHISDYASHAIIGRAFQALTDDDPQEIEYSWQDIHDPMVLYRKAALVENNDARRNNIRQTYSSPTMQLTAQRGRFVLQSAFGAGQAVDLKDITEGLDFEVRSLASIRERLRPELDLQQNLPYWRALGAAVIDGRQARKKELLHAAPSAGDWVEALYESANEEGSEFYFTISTPGFKGRGRLLLEDTVRYLQKSPSNSEFFLDAEGRPVCLEALVVEEEDREGYYGISLVEAFEEYFDDLYTEGREIECNIRALAQVDNRGLHFVGVSKDGASCLIPKNTSVQLQKGDYVRAMVREKTHEGQYVCDFIETTFERFFISSAFRNLVQAMAIVDDTLPSESDEALVEEAMTQEMLGETMALIDRKASLSSNRNHSYGLLCVASWLSHLAGDSLREDYYEKRKRILTFFDDYERNSFLSQDKMDVLIESLGSTLVSGDPLINEAVCKLQILSCLRSEDKSLQPLMKIRQESISPIVRDAADLAMAYLLTARFDIPYISKQLMDRIRRVIEVKGQDREARWFGREDQTHEFKTSIVYHAKGNMLPDMKAQRYTIMKVIAGMLNTRGGGSLFLGVNDEGYACGVDNDLAILNLSEDAYSRHLHKMIRDDLGQVANDCCNETAWEEADGYRVLVVKVRPYPDGALVALDGQYWRRQDSETILLDKEAIDVLQQQQAAKKSASSSVSSRRKSAKEVATPLITSRWRSNVVEPYAEGYGEDTLAYVHFLPQDRYKITDEGLYESTLLSLAIHDDERDGHLLVAYKSGKMVAVEMGQILNKNRNQEGALSHTEQPIFVSPMRPGDEVLTVWENAKGESVGRVDDIDHLASVNAVGSLTDDGGLVHTARFKSLRACEIVPREVADKLRPFRRGGLGLKQKLQITDFPLFEQLLHLSLQ
ncbi:MAG: ATP-binding protein [Bacteroidales bacterium]|nr:ATP-binding protein [Bacteroidales bacterium]